MLNRAYKSPFFMRINYLFVKMFGIIKLGV